LADYTTETKVRNITGFTTTNAPALTTTVIADMITDASREFEVLTGRKWGNANAITEFQDGMRQDAFENKVLTIILSNYPIQSITEFLELNSDGTTAHTYENIASSSITPDTNEYVIDADGEYVLNARIGKITLITRTVPEGVRRIKISYTYGWTDALRPAEVSEIVGCMASLRAISFVTGGIYDGVKSYSVPEMSVGKEQSERLQTLVNYLAQRIQSLLDSPTIGRKERTLFAVTAGTRWGTQTQLSS